MILACFAAHRRVGNNTSCHSSGDLTHQHAFAVVTFDNDCRAFILRRRFRQVGRCKITFVVFEIFNDAVYRKPVDVYIENVHKNGNLNPAVFEIFGFFGFFNNNDFSVGRSDNGVVVHDNDPVRKTEEINSSQE